MAWRRGFGFWAATEKETAEFLGWFHLRPKDAADPAEAELGDVEYALEKADWQQQTQAGASDCPAG